MENKYKISNTKNTAEWKQGKNLMSSYYFCSNCNFPIEIKHTTKLLPFCGRCGFKMKNPKWIKVEDDYEL